MLSVSPVLESSTAGLSSYSPCNIVWKYCRMCALEVKQGVFIFGEEGRRLQLPEKIRKTVAILVLEEDSLPKKVCTNCCNSLESYAQFKDSVIDAQEKLSSIAKSIEKSQEQNLINRRSQHFSRSPKRPKLHSSGPVPQTSSHNLTPALALVSPDNDVVDSPVSPAECDELLGSVVSSEDEFGESSKAVLSYSSTAETNAREDTTEHETQPKCSASTSGNTVSCEVNLPAAPSMNTGQCNESATTSDSHLVVSESEVEGESWHAEAHLICGLCTFKVNKDSLTAHHKENHDVNLEKDPIFGCSTCPRTSSSYEAIRQHIYRHRMAGTFKCVDCSKTYPTKDQLDVHVSSKHNPAGTKPFVCRFCGKQFGYNIALAAHINKKHLQSGSTSISKPETITSEKEVSNMSLSTQGSLSKETRITTPSPTAGTCGSSSSELNSEDHAMEHLQQKTKKTEASRMPVADEVVVESAKDLAFVDEGPDDGYWKCGYCDKILKTRHGYDTHISTHKGRRFTCEYCGVTYTQKYTLEHHIKIHHTNLGKEFECPECKKCFKTIRQLGWHKRVHEKPLRDIKCPLCEKNFLSIVSLKTHMKLHSGSKNFPCSQCPKSFFTRLKMEEHLNSHSGRRPFGCPVEGCTKVFSCYSNYAKHFKKRHFEILGPKGSMVPQPKMIQDKESPASKIGDENDNLPTSRRKESQSAAGATCVIGKDMTNHTSPVKSQEQIQHLQAISLTCESQQQNHHVITTLPPQSIVASLSNAESSALPVQTKPISQLNSSSSFTACIQQGGNSFSSVAPAIPPLFNNSSHGHTSHSTQTSSVGVSTSETQTHPSAAHNQSSVSSLSQTSTHHPHTAHSHAAHSQNHSQTMSQPQQANHFQQSHTQTQSVWQPVVLHGSNKPYHHATSLTTINSLDLLECGASIPAHPQESLASHSHSNSITSTQAPISAAHLSGPSHPLHTNHQSMSSSNGNLSVHTVHNTSSHNHIAAAHGLSNSLSSGHGNSASSSSSTVTVPHFVPSSQQSEPMELSYKLDSNSFQEMPMELTKVFQRDPLELCVRHDFPQPLMDLSSRVVSVTVGGNPTPNVSSLSMNINGTSTSSQNHYGNVSTNNPAGVITVPYHKTVELVERELSLNDFTGAFRQPIDLIARPDDQSHEICSEGNLVDLSLRSSFGQDHSASSFLRELIDLSSRSDTFHGEINLTNKPNQPSAHTPTHLPNNHPPPHHSISKGNTGNNTSTNHPHSHSHHHGHHHHHHSQPQGNQSGNGGGGVTFHNVLYTDAMFGLPN